MNKHFYQQLFYCNYTLPSRMDNEEHCLGNIQLSDSHTGVNLAGLVKDLVSQFNIETDDADTKR